MEYARLRILLILCINTVFSVGFMLDFICWFLFVGFSVSISCHAELISASLSC
jgi:hypothetical protein